MPRVFVKELQTELDKLKRDFIDADQRARKAEKLVKPLQATVHAQAALIVELTTDGGGE